MEERGKKNYTRKYNSRYEGFNENFGKEIADGITEYFAMADKSLALLEVVIALGSFAGAKLDPRLDASFKVVRGCVGMFKKKPGYSDIVGTGLLAATALDIKLIPPAAGPLIKIAQVSEKRHTKTDAELAALPVNYLLNRGTVTSSLLTLAGIEEGKQLGKIVRAAASLKPFLSNKLPDQKFEPSKKDIQKLKQKIKDAFPNLNTHESRKISHARMIDELRRKTSRNQPEEYHARMINEFKRKTSRKQAESQHEKMIDELFESEPHP